jgi:NAD dependent epimerase/dehydratase family
MKVAVVGGTGLVGRHVVRALDGSGHEVVVVSRAAGVDVLTGDGLTAALDGCETVVDVLNLPAQSAVEAKPESCSAARHGNCSPPKKRPASDTTSSSRSLRSTGSRATRTTRASESRRSSQPPGRFP